MHAFADCSDGLLFAATYVLMKSAANAANVGTSLVGTDGGARIAFRSFRSYSSHAAFDEMGEHLRTRSTRPSVCWNRKSTYHLFRILRTAMVTSPCPVRGLAAPSVAARIGKSRDGDRRRWRRRSCRARPSRRWPC